MTELLLWPFVAGLVLTGIHVYFGLHVLARKVVFVDLSLAQVAALGLAVAILAGHLVQSEAAYWYAFAFAILGAVLIALVRPYEGALQQEAVIGIVYAVSAAVGVLVLDRAPQGAEHIKQLLVGTILTVTPQEVASLAALYAALGALHLLLRRPIMQSSFRPQDMPHGVLLLWDALFYASFALVVTSSVRVAGVLLVFCYLIVPAALAGLLATGFVARLVLGWMLGAALTAAGLVASWVWDLPTGPAVVTAFGAAMALAALAFAARRLTLRKSALLASSAATIAGALLLVFPQMDQPWLDALESAAPPLQTVFLSASERATREETLESIARAREELTRLRALDQDVRWNKVEMDSEKRERLRQYLAGKSELSAGDALVLRHLHGKARERQRYLLGLPLLALGIWGIWALLRRPSMASGSN
jgi:zinc/manganese transport system permease protein